MFRGFRNMAGRAMSATVTFVWPHGGTKVELAGSFNGWKPVNMEHSQDKLWSKPYTLKPGRYEFKFVVDGHWIHDPEKDYYLNDLGSYNNIICVAETEVEQHNCTLESISSAEAKGKGRAKSNCTEVEQKFVVPDNILDLLEVHGFKNVHQSKEILLDEYFDTKNHHLLQKDFWLRLRNGDWELKYPVGDQHSEQGSTLYHETSHPGDIVSLICSVVPTSEKESEICEGTEKVSEDKDLNELIRSGALKSFAKLQTERHWFQKDDISIVIDDTDWGFRIGEIEIVVSDESQITKALEKIDELAAQLGLTTLRVGKVNEYLKHHNQRAYQLICQKRNKKL